MRTLLVTGPGGAGTTTVALATARQLHAAGRAVCLVSAGASAALAEGLPVVVVDPLRAFEAGWGRHVDALAEAVPAVPWPPASSVVPPPGSAELALLTALTAVPADRDVVVVDAGPLPQALALLALPGALRWWLGRLAPPRLRVLGAVRTAAVRSGAVRPGPLDSALAAAAGLEQLLEGATATEPAHCTVHLVVRPESAGAAAVTAACTELALLGHRPGAVTVNRVLPAGDGAWWAARSGQQDAALAALGGLDVPLRRVPEAPCAPEDTAALAALGAALDDVAPPASVAPAPVAVDGGWQLDVALPHARRGAVELTRWEDDLVVSVGGVRRSFTLDSLLRRCVVAGGRLAGAGTAAATLEVRFRPDADLWPAGLLDEGGTPA